MDIDLNEIKEKFLTKNSRVKHLGYIEIDIFKSLCYKSSNEYSDKTSNTKKISLCNKCLTLFNLKTNTNDNEILIPLTNNKFALIDKEDFDKIKYISWYALKGMKNIWYASGDRGKIAMHRIILGAKKGEIIDHINMNGLDNRKCNLRKVNKSINIYNKEVRKDSKSGLKNIHYDKINNSYQVMIKLNGKKYYIGRFKNLDKAIIARNNKYLELNDIIKKMEKEFK